MRVTSSKMLLRLIAVLLAYYVNTCENKSISQTKELLWDDTEPFWLAKGPALDLRLPSSVQPSFYRLKIKTDLETFNGDVYITIRANKKVKEIILHSKDLNITGYKLTEQIHQKVDTLSLKRAKRQAANETSVSNTTTIATSQETVVTSNVTSPIQLENETLSQANQTIPSEIVTEPEKTTVSSVSQTVPLDTQVVHSSTRNIKIISISQASGDRLILTLASSLSPDLDYILELSFKGNVSDTMTGFYKSTYVNDKKETKQLGATQFEPVSARSAFPCFDEPAFKAKFEISIAHPNNISVLSNMKVSIVEDVQNETNWKWTHFERSVKMSTYLVAYILSNFVSKETSYQSKDNTTKPVRIWARPELIHKAKYAVEITPKILNYFEDVFGQPYALDKLDLVAIPDFSSGAMENWGLITFKETTLLYDEEQGEPLDKEIVATHIAHEVAHQWFGNLVTMRWWTDLWLNEGFATFMESVGVNFIAPEWQRLDVFVLEKMNLMRRDSQKYTTAISREVIDSSEIAQKFDELSYKKGASLIMMLNHTISEKVFNKGLEIYLNEWKFSNAEENDLWAAMTKVTSLQPTLSHLNIVEFMNSWTRQAGFPVVNVKRDYDNETVTFQQELCTSTKTPYKNMKSQLWYIPISYTRLNGNQTEEPILWLKERSATKEVNISSSQALYVNVDSIGYYRVNYDNKNWDLLTTALNSGEIKSAITRAQLIDDAFNLAKMDLLNYSHALNLTTCVIDGEDSKIVWMSLLNNLMFLHRNLKATPGYRYFQDYVKILLHKQLEKMNFGLDKPKDDNESILIKELVKWECAVEGERCLQWARDQFQAWVTQPDIKTNPIPPHLRSIVYRTALKHGGRKEFDFLWGVFQNSTDPAVKTAAIDALPATREQALIAMLLEKSLSDIPKQYAINVWDVSAPIGSMVAQDFLLDNFDKIYDRFADLDFFMMIGVINGAFGSITREEELNKLKSFALKNKDKLMSISQSLQEYVDSATVRVAWLKRHPDDINRWFEEYIKSHSAVPPPRPANTTEEPLIHCDYMECLMGCKRRGRNSGYCVFKIGCTCA